MADLPIACSLTDPEMRARRDRILADLRRDCLEQQSVSHGIAFRFAAVPGQLERIVELIELERQCCLFLELRLTVTPGEGPIWLEMIGPVGTGDFLKAELRLEDAPAATSLPGS